MIRLLLMTVIATGSLSTSTTAAESVSRWRGQWNSQSTGHHGPMQARVVERPDGQVDARFSGRFAVVIPFTYKVTLTPVACDNCGTTYVTSKKLGPLLGSYQMTARMQGSSFQASFQAAGDNGTFSMTRRK